MSVSDRNIHKKLVWESEAVSDHESNKYLDSIFRQLRSNPEMMMKCNMNVKNQQVPINNLAER